MVGIIGLAVMLALLAALTVGIAFVFEIMAPNRPWKNRAVWSALIAAFLPMSVPIIAVLGSAGLSTGGFIAVASLIFAALFVAAVLCLPVSYLFSKTRSAGRPTPDTGSVFD